MTADRDDLIAQVRTLQEKWRADAERHKKHGDCYRIGEGWALEGCAADLDILLSLLDGPRPEQHKPGCASISHRRSDDGGVTYKWPAVPCDCDGPRRQEPEPK